MAQNPGALKRQKELARLEWQREKAEKRKQRKLEKQEKEKRGESAAPDLSPGE
jgi:hypothetical protein